MWDPASRCWGRRLRVGAETFSDRRDAAAEITPLSLPFRLRRRGSCPEEPAVLRRDSDQLQSHLGARSPRRGPVPHRLEQEGRQRLPICKQHPFCAGGSVMVPTETALALLRGNMGNADV